MNKVLTFANDKIDAANAIISSSGLDFNQKSNNTKKGSGNPKDSKNAKAIEYELGSLADYEA
ncbi:MAG: hypothetical protein HUJ98_04500 [Bacteroidaceae bacterium]|nr:hypothetical protein [Bacteroidaceae bacterium]